MIPFLVITIFAAVVVFVLSKVRIAPRDLRLWIKYAELHGLRIEKRPTQKAVRGLLAIQQSAEEEVAVGHQRGVAVEVRASVADDGAQTLHATAKLRRSLGAGLLVVFPPGKHAESAIVLSKLKSWSIAANDRDRARALLFDVQTLLAALPSHGINVSICDTEVVLSRSTYGKGDSVREILDAAVDVARALAAARKQAEPPIER